MKRLLRTAWFQAALAGVMGGYLSFALRTTRWTIAGEEHFAPHVAGLSAVFAFWHETLPLIPAMCIVAARTPGYRRIPMYTMVSRHHDGQFIGKVVRRFGIEPVLGSSTRGGAAAFRHLLGLLSRGAIIGLTPDGPKGPRRKAASGVALLPAMANVPVLPCAVQMTRKIRTGSWDRMILPLPFGRGVMVFGAPIAVPRAGWEDQVPAIEAAITAALERADRLCAA